MTFDRSRSILLWGEINSDSARGVIEQMLSMEGTKPVNLLINSTGGNIYDAISIIETFKLVPFKVNSIVLGNAFSSAFVVLACSTGKRLAGANTRLMFHPIAADIGYTNHVDAKIIAREFEVTWSNIGRLLNDATKSDFNMDRFNSSDIYLSPTECLNLGVLDRIFTDTSDLDHISNEVDRD